MTRLLAFFVLFGLTFGTASPADWPTFDRDAARSGVAPNSALGTRNVAHLRVRWRVRLDAVADTAPIVVGPRLFETDRAGTTYAVAVATGRIVWRFATHGPNITTSVPVYDSARHDLYVAGVDGRAHELDPRTGHERRGNGFPATLTLAPETEKLASPLNLANGYLYAQTSGYVGDAGPYVGHVVAIRLRDGAKHVFNVLCSAKHTLIEPQTCSAERAGMWSRAGVVVDPDSTMRGRIYVATGNGPFAPAAGNYGDSILALNRDARKLEGRLTAPNSAELETRDLDTGSSSPALLPRQRDSATPLLAVQGGKDAILRLFDRTRMRSGSVPLQSIALGNELFSAPAVWTSGDRTTFVFIRLVDGLRAYRLITTRRQRRLSAAWQTPIGTGSGDTSPVVAGGVIFVPTSGRLVAVDASSGRHLWSGPLGPVHWQAPAIAGNAIYCSDETGALTAFSLR